LLRVEATYEATGLYTRTIMPDPSLDVRPLVSHLAGPFSVSSADLRRRVAQLYEMFFDPWEKAKR